MRTYHILCVILVHMSVYGEHIIDTELEDLCDQTAIYIQTVYKPPNTFKNSIMFSFSRSVLSVFREIVTRWDISQASDYTIEKRQFRVQEDMLRRSAPKRSPYNLVVGIVFSCPLKDIDSRCIMWDMFDNMDYVMPHRDFHNITKEERKSLYTSWTPVCERIVKTVKEHGYERTFEYNSDTGKLCCTVIVPAPIKASAYLLGRLDEPDIESYESSTHNGTMIGQCKMSFEDDISRYSCGFYARTGLLNHLNNPTVINSSSINTPTESPVRDNYPSCYTTQVIVIVLTVAFLALLVMNILVLFRHRLGLTCIDRYVPLSGYEML
uniref:Membrane protein a154 n=1 Tax=Mastomys natalensis cytomegalovirus 2 TaxID=2973540 RepID=A0A9Y1ILL9_9BETA|nr:membrane protein a154 [Mastomys natalensis cytomegalovirus 2]WEG69280.1 membrane protein a154 [Mastomys natalensis cytomegalovirus 2]WEG69419.1 membrane protein a154 [Mastomys natalensis cytomegalovirus 2]WEG69557.1 membrane protein a154 [Mastomys natalensis cytomegalovirus 2]WEG69695.1 membrane protein a154 [Mastomys natalensis cytomegalovirus 2]